MGVVKKLLGPVTQGLMGSKPKTPAQAAPVQAATPAKSAAEISQAEDEERRKRLVALNANNNNGQLTPAGGDTSQAPIGRKALLGQ